MRNPPEPVLLCDSQLPGEFHGGRPRRLHAGQQTPRPAGDHPSADLHRPDAHNLPPGQTSETDHAPSTGRGGGASKPDHLPGAVQHAVPWVGGLWVLISLDFYQKSNYHQEFDKSLNVSLIAWLLCHLVDMNGFANVSDTLNSDLVPAPTFFFTN